MSIRSQHRWACKVCTFENSFGDKVCEMCGNEKGDLHSDNRVESDTSSDSDDLNEFIRIAEKKMSDFCETRGTQYLCLRDGFACSTEKIMQFHIAQRHGCELRVPRDAESKKGIKRPAAQPSTSADEELALQIALQDYDELQNIKSARKKSTLSASSLSSSSSSSFASYISSKQRPAPVVEIDDSPRRRERSIIPDSLVCLQERKVNRKMQVRGYRVEEDNDDEDGDASSQSSSDMDYRSDIESDIYSRKKGVAIKYDRKDRDCIRKKSKEGMSLKNLYPEQNHLNFEERKKMRLDRLLAKTSAIVNKLSDMMKSFSREYRNNHVKSEVATGEAFNHVHMQPSFLTGGTLRDYQLRGVDWLCGIHYSGLNAILADEMGLGKTVQVIAFFCSLWEKYTISGPHLVVVPMSVLNTWRDDILKFSPTISLHIHHGDKEKRLSALANWKHSLASSRKRFLSKHTEKRADHIHILLTTYDLAIKDFSLLKSQNQGSNKWAYLVVDEAHRIKNHTSKLFEKLKKLDARRQLLLTGTPLQNNLLELWALLNFILPQIFNDMKQFTDWFNRPFEIDVDETSSLLTGEAHAGKKKIVKAFSDALSEEERQLIVTSLHKVLKPFLLRRVKTDVLKEVPQKVEKIIHCPLSPLQIKIQREMRSHIVREKMAPTQMLDIDAPSPFFNMNYQNIMTQLRKNCNHPYTILESIKQIDDEKFFKFLTSSSGKFCALERILSNLLPERHKIIIFSQMTTTLDLIESLLSIMGVSFARFDGKVSRENREIQIALFNESRSSPDEDDPCPILLLSTRAGGVGINLQTADTIILFDSDWNPQMDLQAISRAHRIGQDKTVLVLRLVSVNTESNGLSIEQRLLSVANKKLTHERTILEDGKFSFGTISTNSNSNDPVHQDKNNYESLLSLIDSEPSAQFDLRGQSTSIKLSDMNIDLSKMLLNDRLLKRICDRRAENIEVFTRVCSSHAELQALVSSTVSDTYDPQNFPCSGLITTSELAEWSDWFGLVTDDWEYWFKEADSLTSVTDSHSFKSTSVDYCEPSSQSSKFPVVISDQSLDTEVSAEDCSSSEATGKCAGSYVSGKTSVFDAPEDRFEIIKNPINNTIEYSVEDDEICLICGSSTIETTVFMHAQEVWGPAPSVLMYCDGCNETFHPQCVNLDSVPDTDWFCKKCQPTFRKSILQSTLCRSTAISILNKLSPKDSAKSLSPLSTVTVVKTSPSVSTQKNSSTLSTYSSVTFVPLEGLTKRRRLFNNSNASFDVDKDEEYDDFDATSLVNDDSPSRLVCAFCYKKCLHLDDLQRHLYTNECERG